MRTWQGLVVAITVAIAASSSCSDRGDTGDPAIEAAVSSALTPNAPDCADVLQAGEIIPEDITDTGCFSDPDTLEAFGYFDCDDGRQLIETGATGVDLWGFVGEEAHASTTPEVAADPAYGAANDACRP